MSFEFAGYQQRSERFQEELEAPMEDVLGATAEQAITESPVNSIIRFSKLADANVSDDRLDAVVARQRLKDAGLEGRLTIPDTGIATPALDILMDRKKEEIRRQDILSRAPKGIGPGARQLGMAFAASALDPLNIGLAFVPVVGEARYMRYLANARGVLGRTAVRAGVGAAEGAVGAAIVEPLIYAAKSQEQADYDMQDSLLNVAFGTVFGGGLHVLGGLASDAGKALSPAKVARERIEPTVKFDADSPAARVDAMPLPEREVAMRTAVTQAMQGKTVDVEPFTPTSSRTFRRVFHGSPHQFDQFNVAKMGTGEGAQAQGWGMYFAEEPAVARSYTDDNGYLYEVDIPEEEVSRFINWDKSLDEQPDNVHAAALALGITDAKDGEDLYWKVKRTKYSVRESMAAHNAGESAKYASEKLNELGVPGIKYLDAGSRDGGEGTRNLVVFDESLVRINRRDRIAELHAAAERQASPESEITADVPAALAADRQLAEAPKAPDPVAEQEALLADELAQLKETARVADIDLGDELAEFDEAIKLADEYGKAARAAVLCGMAH